VRIRPLDDGMLKIFAFVVSYDFEPSVVILLNGITDKVRSASEFGYSMATVCP